MIKHLANIVTFCRILGSILLFFFPVFSIRFYIIYIICGFSDMTDGTIARSTKSASELGSKLDTVADLVFVAVSMIKLLPAINIPGWLFVWCIVIATIKIINIIWGYVSKKQFIALHSIMNKLAGALLFLLPLTLSIIELKYSAIAVCSVATLASIHESVCIGSKSNKARTKNRLTLK